MGGGFFKNLHGIFSMLKMSKREGIIPFSERFYVASWSTVGKTVGSIALKK